MRSFMTTISAAVLLVLLGVAPVAAESIDIDVRAARAAERTESMQIEQDLSAPAPAEPVSVSVTEVPDPVDSDDAGSASVNTKQSEAANATAPTAKSSARSDESGRSDASDRSEASPKAAAEPLAVAPAHSDRPDKVALMLGAEKSGQADKKSSGSIGTVVMTILKLAVVLILAYLTILALKWFSARNEAAPSNNRQFKMLDTLRFSSTSSMHLIKIKETTLLVGCTAGQVNVLKEFEEGAMSDGDGEPAGKFAEYLAKYSDMSAKHGPSGRIAGLLRDCSGYLRNRCQGARVEARDEK